MQYTEWSLITGKIQNADMMNKVDFDNSNDML